MIEEIIGAAVGSIVTAGIGFFQKIVGGIKQVRENNIFQKGDCFSGNWFLYNGKGNYEDSLCVTSVKFGKIKCTGKLIYENKEKHYYLQGVVNHYCITFIYYGLENNKKDNTAGVVLLEKSRPDIDELNGKWIQLKKNGELIHGNVVLKRKT